MPTDRLGSLPPRAAACLARRRRRLAGDLARSLVLLLPLVARGFVAPRAGADPAPRPPASSPAEALSPAPESRRSRPLLRDFMGLNVHTVLFKPALYAPVCRRLRDYHPLDWDTGDDPSRATTFPMAANRVDWGRLYGDWARAGFDVDACVIFDNLPPAKWRDPGRDARAYGEAFARFFGPSAGRGLVSAVEVGNEPAKYTEGQYRALFEGMARGLRAGDPRLKIAGCAVMTGKTDPWSKPLSALAGLETLYDVLNLHCYPFKEAWPTWRRSYPEDPSIPFLKSIDDLLRWRDAHAPGKEVWLTEFGYDSATKPPDPRGPWKQWVGVSDEQQAQYVVRAFLALSATELDRAYLFFFNDKDEPQLHGASGITRDFKPKPAFHAMAHLYRSLGDCRFVRAVARDEGALYCFEYEKAREGPGAPGAAVNHADAAGERVYVAWSPTAGGAADRPTRRVLPLGAAAAGRIYRAERMATSADGPRRVEWRAAAGGIEVEVGPAPVFLWAR